MEVAALKKDILNLVYLSEYFGLPEVAEFWEGVVKLNDWHQHRISKLITKKLFGSLSNKKIAILGFAFKANTNDTRESAAIKICKDLIEEGAMLFIHDPKVESNQITKDLGIVKNSKVFEEKNLGEGSWFFAENLEEAIDGSDAILILTEWEEYSQINWDIASKKMRRPSWVFDARSIIDPEKVKNSGLNLWRIGDGS